MKVIILTEGKANRFGGREIDGGFGFELSGGAIALDFANTLDERPGGGVERLTDYNRLLQWSEQAGALNAGEVARLARAAAADSPGAEKAVESARVLRELVFSVVNRSVSSREPTPLQVRQLNAWVRRAALDRQLEARPGGLAWRAPDKMRWFDAMLPRVAESIVSILTDEAATKRLRLCSAERCDWLFLDTTRRQNRIWCDMSVCGNRAKARRHYHRGQERDQPC